LLKDGREEAGIMAKMIFSVGGSSGLGWKDYLEVAQACDELGFYGFYPSDHLGPIQAGRGPATDRLDAMTALAALSGHTKRLRLGALVMGNHFRHPVMTAKIVGALDHVSGGRAELGLGASATKDEHVGHGIEYPPFKERLERLDEALELIKALWTQERATFHGKHYTLEGVEYHPKPVQKPYPPIIVGGSNIGTLRIAARHADEWNTTATPLKTKAAFIQQMREMGRDFSTLRVSHQMTIHLASDRADAQRFVERQISLATSNPRFKLQPQYTSAEEQVRDSFIVGGVEEIKEGLRKWLGLGVTHMNMPTPRPFKRQVLERMAKDVAPAFN
jgi:alkanesulfonate monooxygenase SsuD/methylene tetrahydromethanopterin reductase-like flavin-dependent oxidoreductase (luciferase family)